MFKKTPGALVSNLRDFKTVISKQKYMVLTESEFKSKEEWYGPPDPVPTGYSTHGYLSVRVFTEEELLEWLADRADKHQTDKIEIVKIEKSVEVETKLSIKLA